MTTASSDSTAAMLTDAWPAARHRLRSIAAVGLAISPPFLCALLAQHSGRWDWFERSGSITTAIGLLVASRRYIEHSSLEIATRHHHVREHHLGEELEYAVTAKLGLALSAFGTLIWGLGSYLCWWSFSCLAIWGLLALRDVRRDFKKFRNDTTAPFPCEQRELGF